MPFLCPLKLFELYAQTKGEIFGRDEQLEYGPRWQRVQNRPWGRLAVHAALLMVGESELSQI